MIGTLAPRFCQGTNFSMVLAFSQHQQHHFVQAQPLYHFTFSKPFGYLGINNVVEIAIQEYIHSIHLNRTEVKYYNEYKDGSYYSYYQYGCALFVRIDILQVATNTDPYFQFYKKAITIVFIGKDLGQRQYLYCLVLRTRFYFKYTTLLDRLDFQSYCYEKSLTKQIIKYILLRLQFGRKVVSVALQFRAS